MNKTNLKVRANFNEKFCNAIERGKCCYKTHHTSGFCDLHFQLFSLLFTDISKVVPKTLVTIHYEINPISIENKCKIFDKKPKSKKLIPCPNLIQKKGLCGKHYQILELIGCLTEFLDN